MKLLSSFETSGTYSRVFELLESADMYGLLNMAEKVQKSGLLKNSFIVVSSSKSNAMFPYEGEVMGDLLDYDMVSVFGMYRKVQSSIAFHSYHHLDRTPVLPPAVSVSVLGVNIGLCRCLSRDLNPVLEGRRNATRDVKKEIAALRVPTYHGTWL